MSTVKLKQGSISGTIGDGVHCYLGIAYTKSFVRFQQPEPVAPSDQHYNVSQMAAMPPQTPSRLESVMGPFPAGTGSQDERSCGVLSVYVPVDAGQALPVIAWLHGGAWVSGGSQTPIYDGQHLARDGRAIVVCISYRLGPFGFLYQPGESLQKRLPPGLADVVAALEWIQANIGAFGGDKDCVTAFGQSAGAYHIQTLFDIRPDLFARAVLQSSPAGYYTSKEAGAKVASSVERALKSTLEAATTEELLAAHTTAETEHADMWLPFCPVTDEDTAPGGRARAVEAKEVLIGWMKDDGLCFARIAAPHAPVEELDTSLTRLRFQQPADELAKRLRSRGHQVSTFELTWAPEGFELGATHCVDLPLCFGSQEAWKKSPMMGKTSWAEWEHRGHRHRTMLGLFAKDGTVPTTRDGMTVFS